MNKRIDWFRLALPGLALLGVMLRLYGLNWDQGNAFQPDERLNLFSVAALLSAHSLPQVLATANALFHAQPFTDGMFPLTLLAMIGWPLRSLFPALAIPANLALLARCLNALFDGGTILLSGLLALRLTRQRAPRERSATALLAAALIAFTPLQLQLAHFYTGDTILLFFVLLTLLACVALIDTDGPRSWSLLAGAGIGLALAIRFSAFLLIVPLLAALLMRCFQRGWRAALSPLLTLLPTAFLLFTLANPIVILDFAAWRAHLGLESEFVRGVFDLPYIRQFAATTPYLYQARNMLFWGIGLMAGVVVCAGLLWLCWRVWNGTIGPWLVMLLWVVAYGALVGDFYVKFLRYVLPIYPCLMVIASGFLLAMLRWATRISSPLLREDVDDGIWADHEDSQPTSALLSGHSKLARGVVYGVIALALAGTIFQGLALLHVYSQPNTRLQASRWVYEHVKAGSRLAFEVWDDPLPVAVDGHDPAEFAQLTYFDAQGEHHGLDLYSDDTLEKAELLATLLPGVDAIIMASDRLDLSIPRLPARYPLTLHYYQLLFSGQLGFHLAAQFENRPSLLGLTLDDRGADESYSVFDHPVVRIFVRDAIFPYTLDSFFHLLLRGVRLPPPGMHLSGTQKPLLLTAQQIADDQQSPAFGTQFPSKDFANTLPVVTWWLALLALGLMVFPLSFLVLRGLADRGYLFSKLLGMLLLAYCAWMLASLRVMAFSSTSIWMMLGGIYAVGIALAFWQRHALRAFLRERWRLLLLEETLFTLAYLLFVGIRSLNPDLWHLYLGGEKPMELAFLNAVLRSPFMPPLDPWYAGGYINYYYYGYVLIGSLIKLTGIAPTTAFNLAIPTLFALTFCGAFSLVYSLIRRYSLALIGGYFAALIGNFDGLLQLKTQLGALLAHLPVPAFNYWQSSRVIPDTINEFPFWSFLFADLHPHVMNMPIVIFMLAIVALCGNEHTVDYPGKRMKEDWPLYALAAFVFGTLAIVNPWDMPVYALLLGAALLLRVFLKTRRTPFKARLLPFARALIVLGLLCMSAYLLYWPFYSNYQELYVNGLGLVEQGTNLRDFLTINDLWIFLTLSFFLLELSRWWRGWLKTDQSQRTQARGLSRLFALTHTGDTPWRIMTRALIYVLPCAAVLTFALDLKASLALLIILGIALLFLRREETHPFIYLTLLMGVAISLGVELVYVRDFLDGSAYERMNTVFKFSLQAWFCFAIGGALALQHVWKFLRGPLRPLWIGALALLIIANSVFLAPGTLARIQDHRAMIAAQQPVASPDYTPTLDGMAFVRAWYPGDAQAISWINEHIAGSPVILEAASPISFSWFGRVSVYTGLPDVVGWLDHVSEQRYSDQVLSRMTDVGIIYTTSDPNQALVLLHFYHVRYMYVGDLERQVYTQQSTAGLDKFERMVGSSLRVVYRAAGVTIYEVVA